MRAVFLDRDGVLNANVLNPATQAWESPHRVEAFRLHEGVIEALHRLQAAGYLLVVVSNQPSYAKGKTSLENIQAIAARLESEMTQADVKIARYCYCLHYPQGIVPEYSFKCECRKPSPYFLIEAAKDFDIDLSQSWMIGDRETDIECGKAAGTRTIFIKPDHPHAAQKTGADFTADHLAQGVDIILSA